MILLSALFLVQSSLPFPETKANIRPDAIVKTYEEHEAAAMLAKYADCLVSTPSARKKVVAALRHAKNSNMAKALTGDCLSERDMGPTYLSMRISMVALPAALYPALYRKVFGYRGVPRLTESVPIFIADEFDVVPNTVTPEWRARRALGNCIVRATPSGTHAMLMARPWSTTEDAAVPAVVGALRLCLTSEQTLRLNRDDLRAMAGEALYKLLLAASANSTGISGTKN